MSVVSSDFRIRRHASNQLMMLWLRRDLRSLSGRDTAVDVGCGRFINRPAFKTRQYVGVDNMPSFIEHGRKIYPDARGHVGSVLTPIPEQGEVVVCTLVLNNKRFPHERTVEAVRNLVAAVRPGGDLLFTLGQVNAAYESAVDDILARSFDKVEKRVYGRFNFPTYFSYPLAWLMDVIPRLRVDKDNRMLYIRAMSRRSRDASLAA
jgi:SAM-dependent methyltransferase